VSLGLGKTIGEWWREDVPASALSAVGVSSSSSTEFLSSSSSGGFSRVTGSDIGERDAREGERGREGV